MGNFFSPILGKAKRVLHWWETEMRKKKEEKYKEFNREG
jgi:hypothetical protein